MSVSYGTIDVAIDTFANDAALAALDTTGYFNGARAIINALGVFRLDLTSQATVDNTTVINASAGGRWLVDSLNGVVLTSGNKIAPFQISDTGFLGLDDGTASAPSLYFTDDTNTGMYRISADTIGLAAGGVLSLTIGTAAVVSALPAQMPAGSAAAPSLRFTAEQTGAYLVSANVLGLTIAGTQKAQLTATQFELLSGVAYAIDGNQVVGARATGWVAFTGAATTDHSSINTGTITATDGNIQALAQAVNGIQQALTTHGLIGPTP